MFTQLNPPIPMTSLDKGDGLAIGVIDYSPEYNLMWVIVINETGEIWTMANPRVRGQKNITMGRLLTRKEVKDVNKSTVPPVHGPSDSP